jgi:hypothetical protein
VLADYTNLQVVATANVTSPNRIFSFPVTFTATVVDMPSSAININSGITQARLAQLTGSNVVYDAVIAGAKTDGTVSIPSIRPLSLILLEVCLLRFQTVSVVIGVMICNNIQ